MNCSKCNMPLPEKSAFCPTCGSPVEEQPKFCSKCGRKLVAGENGCLICDRKEAAEIKEDNSKPKSIFKEQQKSIFGCLIVILYIFTTIGRGVGDIAAVFAVPILLVCAIVQSLRKTEVKKWWKRFGVSVLLVIVMIGVEEFLPVPSDIWARKETSIIGEWSATTSEVEDSKVYYDAYDLVFKAKKNGKAYLKSYDSTLNQSFVWEYNKDGSETAKEGLGDSASMYNLYYEEVDNDNLMFKCLVHGDTLYLMSMFDEKMEFLFERVD